MLTKNLFAQTGQDFILDGQISGLRGVTKLYLIAWPEPDTIARTIAKDGKFTFTGKVNGANAYFIKMDTLVSKKPSKAIWMMSKKLQMISSLENWPGIEIKGSEAHDDSKALEQIMLPLDLKLKKRYDEKIVDSARKLYVDFIKNHTNSLYVPFMISKSKGLLKPEDIANAYENLTARAKNSYHGLILKKEVDKFKFVTQLRPGAVLPDFKLSTPDGTVISVLEFAKKGKITLIDYWASWCKPCRQEIPNMRKVYKAFHGKGLNILGISTDKKESDWKKALKEENTSWIHGRDNLENAWKEIFDIGAIPAFALVNGEGKLLAFSCASSTIHSFGPEIRGEALYKTIEDLLTKKDK